MSGSASMAAASAAASAVSALMVFPLIASSDCVALMGLGATAPRAILASRQTPLLVVMIDATLTMGKSTALRNLNLRNVCLAWLQGGGTWISVTISSASRTFPRGPKKSSIATALPPLALKSLPWRSAPRARRRYLRSSRRHSHS